MGTGRMLYRNNGKECNCFHPFPFNYLSNLTAVPTIVAVNLITMPEDNRKGKNKPISKVRVLSGFGNRAGVSVASSKPSKYSIT